MLHYVKHFTKNAMLRDRIGTSIVELRETQTGNPTGCGEKIGPLMMTLLIPLAKALISIEIGDIIGVAKVLVRFHVIPSK